MSVNINQVIRDLRKAQKLSADDVAQRAGVSKQYLYIIEQNKRNPTVLKAQDILRALGYTFSVKKLAALEDEEK